MTFRRKLVSKISTILKVNLFDLALQKRGIGGSVNKDNKAEFAFLQNDLPKFLDKKEKYILFDVGQNKGDYTQLLINTFKSKMFEIHGFEPNSVLQKRLESKFGNMNNIFINRMGLGSKRETLKLFKYRDGDGHSSVLEEVMTSIHNYNNVKAENVTITTISDYVNYRNINTIDFIKIDIEGFELEALKGAGAFLNKIKVIQFEFNEMNLVSRVLLRDFYELLNGFEFYRISDDGLIELGEYSTKNEIFHIQNIIAVNRNLKIKI